MIKFKNISCAMAVVVASAVATSCNKLDEYNPTGTTDDAIWSTPAGFMTVVNSSYHYIHDWYGSENGTFMLETGTDLWMNTVKNIGYAYGISQYEALDGSQSTNRNAWANTFMGLNLCNSGIAAIDKAGFTDPTEKARRLGELRFLRALHLYHIVEQWGGVMLRTTPTDGALLTATRSSVESFYDVMIEDLAFAKDNLPVNWGAAVGSASATSVEYMRASKKSAYGLLARVYLTRAYYASGADATSYFTKAKETAQYLIDNAASLDCGMWDTPANLWNPNNNKNNKESLFSINYSAAVTTYNFNGANGNRMYKWWNPVYASRPGLSATIEYGNDNDNKYMPTWHMLDLFDDTKDARYAACFQEVWKATTAHTWTLNTTDTSYHKDAALYGTTVPAGDTAMYITKGVIDNKFARRYLAYDATTTYQSPVAGQGAKISRDANYHPYYVNFKKFADYTRTATTVSGGYNDVFVMRLAEMYLIVAEAAFKLGDNATAAARINFLRARATKSGQDMQISAGDITRDFLLDERARETCGELQRWYDLKRMLTASEWAAYIKKWNPDIVSVQTYHRLRPIPTTELTALLNAAEFGQNPNYP